MLPVFSRFASLGPAGLESTGVSLLYALLQTSRAVNKLASAGAAHLLGVTAHRFKRLSLLVLLCGGAAALPLPLARYIPEEKGVAAPVVPEAVELVEMRLPQAARLCEGGVWGWFRAGLRLLSLVFQGFRGEILGVERPGEPQAAKAAALERVPKRARRRDRSKKGSGGPCVAALAWRGAVNGGPLDAVALRLFCPLPTPSTQPAPCRHECTSSDMRMSGFLAPRLLGRNPGLHFARRTAAATAPAPEELAGQRRWRHLRANSRRISKSRVPRCHRAPVSTRRPQLSHGIERGLFGCFASERVSSTPNMEYAD